MLVLHPCAAAEKPEGYLIYKGATPKEHGVSTLYWAPQPRDQKEEPTYHLAVKLSGDSVHQGETGIFYKPKCPLKRPVHKITFIATHAGLW